jgi:hypothetical protein
MINPRSAITNTEYLQSTSRLPHRSKRRPFQKSGCVTQQHLLTKSGNEAGSKVLHLLVQAKTEKFCASSGPSLSSLRRWTAKVMEDSNSTELLWISSSCSDTPSDRSKLRREVMQKVALRRRKEPKRHHPNSRQLPVFITNDGLAESTASQKYNRKYDQAEIIDKDSCLKPVELGSDIVYSDDIHPQTTLTQLLVFPCTSPSMLSKCNLDFLDLSLLASCEVGRYTGQRLLESPRSISHFLGGKNWSYCRYVPFHYSQSVLVRNAADCVVARVRCLLTPNATEWESLAVASYSRALSILQKAINSTSERPTADILCATQILGLYEVSYYPP